MGYLQLLAVAIMWSLVGVTVKTASHMVDSNTISLCRFLFGCIFLAFFMRWKGIPIRFLWKNKWIWIGIIAKSMNYILENYAITLGFVYAQVIVVPIQGIFLALAAIWCFGEKLYAQKIIAVVLCLGGVLLVSWKGTPLSLFFANGFLPTVFFTLAAAGAAIHLVCQKKLIPKMDSGNMNLSMFVISTLIVAIPVPFTFRLTGGVQLLPVASLIVLGGVTGLSFFLYAEALKKVSFLIAGIISNSSVLFTLLWSRIFFHENINGYVIAGALIMVAGLIIINLPQGFRLWGRRENNASGNPDC